MKRPTARKRILTHLNDYRKRLAKDGEARLGTYYSRTGQLCPLCTVCGHSCDDCLRWPGGDGCFAFKRRVYESKAVRTKLRWIDKLEKELERWATEP